MADPNQRRVHFIIACITCGKNLRDNWNFCPSCSTPLDTVKCFNCDKNIRYHWRYCPFCKKEVKQYSNRERIEQCNEWLRDILGNKKV